ncbi:S1/P1 nuclease [Mesorhizobium sp. URHB0026]
MLPAVSRKFFLNFDFVIFTQRSHSSIIPCRLEEYKKGAQYARYQWLGAAVSRATISFIIALFFTQSAFAWGASGHSIVAELAQRRLTPTAEANLEILIGRASLASIASWADDFKFTPAGTKTKRWHYVDADVSGDGHSWRSGCELQAEGDCLPLALEREIKVLSNPGNPLIARQIALRFVVHLAGDLTQPFHCANYGDDGGGNSIKIDFTGRGLDGKEVKVSSSLHSLWDDGLINAHAFSWGAYLEELDATTAPTVSADSDIDYIGTWADACHEAGKTAYKLLPAGWQAKVAAGAPIVLDSTYQIAAQPLLDRQLAVGGLQLAVILNEALGKTSE